MENLLKKITKIKIASKIYKEFPETPGVYIFYKDAFPIYIGKAINLKRRVSSYFDLNLEPKTAAMVAEANNIGYIKVTSELESLLLEAKLIRHYLPQYNIAAKDDKHPLYVRITKDKYPRIVTARKIAETEPNIAFYGPFPSSKSVRAVLKMLRRIFPYSDHQLGKRACFYSHLNLCDPCPNIIDIEKDPELRSKLRKTYKANIRHIKAILDGKIANVRSKLVVSMRDYSNLQDFENAGKVRDQIRELEYITRPQMPTDFYIENPNLYEDTRIKELDQLKGILRKFSLEIRDLKRIECFDVAHLAGSSPTASMVTFIEGEADKNYYRHFRIRQKNPGDDYSSMREVIARRAKHFADWGMPDLIIVDGGKGQLSVFLKELEGKNIPVVGIAKRFETLVIPQQNLGTTVLREFRLPRGSALNLIQRVRDEAHRFARVYHHQLIKRQFVI